MADKSRIITPSERDMNEDWIKTRPSAWDIRKTDFTVVKTLDDLRELGWNDDRIAQFFSWPSSYAAPESLLQDLADDGWATARARLDERAVSEA